MLQVRQLERSNQEYEQQLWSHNKEVRQVQEQLQSRADANRAADEGLNPNGSTQYQLEQATQQWLSQVGATPHPLLVKATGRLLLFQ